MTRSSLNDQAFDELIGQLQPPVSSIPHLVVRDSSLSLRALLDASGSIAGWWGNWPIYTIDDTPFVGSDEVLAFSHWKGAKNQEWIQSRQRYAILGRLSILTDITCPKQVLDQWHATVGPDKETTFRLLWPDLSSTVSSVGWLYVPLSDEYSVALVLGEIAVLSRMASRLVEIGEEVRQIKSSNGVDSWQLPPAWL